MENWTLLRTFESEGEARVVESVLNAEGIETQLLGSHSRAAGPVPEILQLRVRPADLPKAQEILQRRAQ
jgi:hypothetical protein